MAVVGAGAVLSGFGGARSGCSLASLALHAQQSGRGCGLKSTRGGLGLWRVGSLGLFVSGFWLVLSASLDGCQPPA